MYVQIKELEEKIAEKSEKLNQVKAEIGKEVIGQEKMIERILIGLLTGGHILLEGLPGLAKTLTVNALANSVEAAFKRIQFTPDMLPADLVGTNIYNPSNGSFTPKKGPVFSQIVLADEINRAPAKVQSALLEVMQEKQVTIGAETFKLEDPYLVLATQNPIEQEGTYPLPEAQVDRFMMKLIVGYPDKGDERKILEKVTAFSQPMTAKAVIDSKEILEIRSLIQDVYLDDKIKDYIVELVDCTRHPAQYHMEKLASLIEVGASPRATITLAIASRALAFMRGRGYVTPQDVKIIAPDVMRHRMLLTYEAEAEEMSSDDILEMILNQTPVP